MGNLKKLNGLRLKIGKSKFFITWMEFEGMKCHGWRLFSEDEPLDTIGWDLSRNMNPKNIREVVKEAINLVNFLLPSF